MSLLGAALLPVVAAGDWTSIHDIPDDARRRITLDEARAELLPLFPAGTEWPAGSDHATFRSDAGLGHRIELTFSASLNNVRLRVTGFDGPVLAALHRVRATRRWVVLSLQNPELFDFDHPDEN